MAVPPTASEPASTARPFVDRVDARIEVISTHPARTLPIQVPYGFAMLTKLSARGNPP